MASPASIKALLKQACEQLRDISDSAQLDAELLLAHCLDKNRSYLHTWPEKELDATQLDNFYSLIEKRRTDYPVAYLIGKKPFWTFDLKVTPDVLIPRPETELLVEIALEKIKNIKSPKVLDLGTGSGAIALAIASERPDAKLTATDFSEKALAVSINNAKSLALVNQLRFVRSDWFDGLADIQFDLIVSNPPYINPTDPHLEQTIRYEPLHALIADNEGMSDIEKIIQKSPQFIKTGGWLLLEHGFDQHQKTQQVMRKYSFKQIKSIEDLNGNMRLTQAQTG